VTDADVQRGADTAEASASASVEHLLERLALVERRVRRAVALRRSDDPAPDDPYRGLYLTDDAVDRVLAGRPPPSGPDPAYTELADRIEQRARHRGSSRLRDLTDRFGLSALDVDIMLIALAPDVDIRFERLYGYLNDDVTRRRATIGLALELCAVPATSAAGRARFGGAGPLCAGHLLAVEEPERPMLSRILRVPDRVTAYLLGDDKPDTMLATFARRAAPPGSDVHASTATRLAAVLSAGVPPVYLRRRSGADAVEPAVAALAASGHAALLVDPAALAEQPDPLSVLAVLLREARLGGAGLVVGPIESIEPDRAEPRRLLRRLTGLATDVPVVLHGEQVWDPDWSDLPVLTVPAEPVDAVDRTAAWLRALDGHATTMDPAEASGALAPYTLNPAQVGRAARVAAGLAVLDGVPVTAAHLRDGARAQNGAGLARLARRVEPAVGWDDLVLPDPVRAQLGELAMRARHRERVLGQWRMRPGGGRGHGVMALFAGESGTGKTMSAEVVAAELGLDLYVVDLSSVVDKYVGQTEKNLERIFTEAAGVNGVLLFDEADAIFGKRSEVRDAHDRYANMESAYLLQRMESFDGVAVLTTNLRANLDEAFTRRLDVVVDFPVPDTAGRLALWDRCLGPMLPRAADLDLVFCAERFELAGGSIRACAVTAAYLAAESDRPVGMAELTAAIRTEYRKLGRLLLDSEFGQWLERSG
jgi:hypothetical protein